MAVMKQLTFVKKDTHQSISCSIALHPQVSFLFTLRDLFVKTFVSLRHPQGARARGIGDYGDDANNGDDNGDENGNDDGGNGGESIKHTSLYRLLINSQLELAYLALHQ